MTMLLVEMDETQKLIFRWIFSIWIQVPSTIALRSQLDITASGQWLLQSVLLHTQAGLLGCWVAGWWVKQCTEEMMWSRISLLTFYQSFKKESSKHHLLSAFECFGTSWVQIWYLESTRILILPNSKQYANVFVWWRFVHRSSWKHHRSIIILASPDSPTIQQAQLPAGTPIWS